MITMYDCCQWDSIIIKCHRNDKGNGFCFGFFEQLLDSETESHNMTLPGKRSEQFKVKQAIDEDYRDTGFDKGHLNPNFYHCSSFARSATFTLTNAVPQDPCFNRLVWFALENEAKNIMDSLCSFNGAKRFFITGTVPSENRIPNREHDFESDRKPKSDFERVSVPSHMWTAACCDSSEALDPDDRKRGFSFGYLGENKAGGSVTASSVRELENGILAIPPTERSIKIFVNDYCKEDSNDSKKAVAKIRAVVAKSILNRQNRLDMTDISQLPDKKRRLDADEFKTVTDLGKKVLFDLTLGLALPNKSQVVNNYRDKLKLSSDLTVIMTGFDFLNAKSPLSHTELDNTPDKYSFHEKKVANATENKRQANSSYKKNRGKAGKIKWYKGLSLDSKAKFIGRSKMTGKEHPLDEGQYLAKKEEQIETLKKTDTYMFAPKLNALMDVTVNGDYCQPDHKCDYHDGYKYKWCKTTSSSWDYCCLKDCLSTDYQSSIPTCDVGNGTNQTCSMRSSIITVKGGRCRQDHECALHGNGYYWCYTDFDNNWDYCCQPWHRCDYYDGEDYRWCYAGSSLETKWRHCYYQRNAEEKGEEKEDVTDKKTTNYPSFV